MDDNKVNVKVLGQVMKRIGYTDFQTAFDGQAAVDRCVEGNFDLVLMDIEVCW